MQLHRDVTDPRAIKAYKTLLKMIPTLHNGKYDYSKSIYSNARTPIIVICPVHGDWETSTDNHFRNNTGCPKCDKSGKIDTQEFVKRAIQVHGDKYSYTNTLYTTNPAKVLITCKIHGDFLQRANDHISGKGCSKCVNELKRVKFTGKYYKGKKAILYYIEIVPGIFKVGITTRTVEQRFKSIKPFDTIYKVTYREGLDAYNVEQQILNKIDTKDVLQHLTVKIPGYTEMSTKPFLLTFMECVKDSNYETINYLKEFEDDTPPTNQS